MVEETCSQKQMSDTLKDILETARELRQKSRSRGESGEGDRDAEDSKDGAWSDGYPYAETDTGDAQVG